MFVTDTFNYLVISLRRLVNTLLLAHCQKGGELHRSEAAAVQMDNLSTFLHANLQWPTAADEYNS